jgi:ABC-type bacteriocin/lantibiotic exporter with double-glycine peptidase domain
MLHFTSTRLAVTLCLCGAVCAADQAGVWLDVPFVKQEKNGCGAASIAMVMQYWRNTGERTHAESVDATAIQRSLYSRDAHGIYASDLERYFRQNGFHTFAIHAEWNDLRQQLEKGRPLIVALRPGASSSLHYAVVTGLDWQQQLVMLNDPAQRKLLKQERSSFEKEWKAAGNWALLAVPRQAHR